MIIVCVIALERASVSLDEELKSNDGDHIFSDQYPALRGALPLLWPHHQRLHPQVGQEWEGRGKEKDIFETEAVLTQTLVQVLSTHSPDIVLDKYNFELGYDDDFDMGGFRIILIEITLKDDYIIESLIDVECRM